MSDDTTATPFQPDPAPVDGGASRAPDQDVRSGDASDAIGAWAHGLACDLIEATNREAHRGGDQVGVMLDVIRRTLMQFGRAIEHELLAEHAEAEERLQAEVLRLGRLNDQHMERVNELDQHLKFIVGRERFDAYAAMRYQRDLYKASAKGYKKEFERVTRVPTPRPKQRSK